MMLNEIQKQHRTIEEQTQELDALKKRLSDLEKTIESKAEECGHTTCTISMQHVLK